MLRKRRAHSTAGAPESRMRAFLLVLFLVVACGGAHAAVQIEVLEIIRVAQQQVQQGKFEAARGMLAQGLALIRAEDGHASLEGIILNNLCDIAIAQGRFREAEVSCRRSISLWESLGPEGREPLSKPLNNLAMAYFHQGKYQNAERVYLRSLAVLTDLKGPNHPDLGAGLNGLCATERAMRRFSDAEAHCRRAMAVLEGAGDLFRWKLSESFLNLALVYVDQNELTVAAEWSERAAKTAAETTLIRPAALIQIFLATADIRLKLGLRVEALDPLQRAESAVRQYFSDRHPLMAAVLVLRARTLRAENANTQARKLQKRAVQIINAYRRDHLTDSTIDVSELQRRTK